MGQGKVTKVVEKTSKRDGPTKKERVLMAQKKGMTVMEIAEAADTTVNSVRWYLSKAQVTAKKAEQIPHEKTDKESKKK